MKCSQLSLSTAERGRVERLPRSVWTTEHAGTTQPMFHVPSGSQSFFRARHMGALILRFLPL